MQCRSRFNASLLSACALMIASPPLWGDTVELSRGGHLEGQVQRRGDVVIVRVDDQIQVAVPESRVRRVVTSAELAEYRKQVIAAGEDAEKHYQLAIWCLKSDNVPGDSTKYRDYHMRRAIELNPDHVKARAALGYTRNEGRWVLSQDLMRDRGMISRGGSWELPEAVAIEDYQDASNVEAKKWIREVNRLVGVVQRGSKKAAEALESLRGIRDPSAASAIARQLDQSREQRDQNRSLRMLWVRLLGDFHNMIAVEALVKAGLEERDQVIREAALDELKEYGASSAVATYVPYLKSNDNKLVNRAAQALSWFPDPELALTYVDALVTTHKTQSAPGPGLSVGFGDGGGGLSTGGKPKVTVEQRTNPAVLSLLKQVEPEADFGYDEQKWLQYFAAKRNRFSGDLRRDTE